MSNKTNFENQLKNKLEDFQPNHPAGDWKNFRKKLPGNKSNLWLKAGLPVAGVIIISAVLILNRNNETDNPDNNDVNTEQITNNQKSLNKSEAEISKPEKTKTKNQDNATKETKQEETKSSVKDEKELPEKDNEKDLTHKSKDNTHTKNIKDQDTTTNIEETPKETETRPKEYYILVNNESGCKPLKVNFKTNISAKKYNFLWDFGDGNTSSKSEPEHTYSEKGMYKPVLKITSLTDNSKTELTHKSIKVYDIVEPEIIADKKNNSYVFSTDIEDSENSTFNWEINGNELNGKEVKYNFHKDGNYKIKLSLINEHKCESHTTKDIDIKIKHEYFVPNAINIAGFGENSRFIPKGGNLDSMDFRMLIYNRKGEVIFSTNSLDNPWEGKNSKTNNTAKPGVYLYKITTKDKYGNVRHKKGQVTLINK